MRILWCGVGPWHTSAYAQQTRLFLPRFRDLLGHDMALWFFGDKGTDDVIERAHPASRATLRTGLWEGIPAAGVGSTRFSLATRDQARALFGGQDPDLVLCLKDPFEQRPPDYKGRRSAVWANVDCDPLSRLDRLFFMFSGARPIATSRFGKNKFREAGFDPLYVPHAVDLSLYGPPSSKAAAKEHLGLPADSFVAGLLAMNLGTIPRKAFYEQMAAWSSFTERGRVPGCYLLMHTNPQPKDGIDLRAVARHLGLVPDGCTCGGQRCPLPLAEHKVIFGAHEQQKPADLVSWYQALDVYLGATYGEGFGVPIIEALACGVPVIGSKNTAITEKIGKGCGWLVGCQPFWHWDHEAEWRIPRIPEIAAALGHAMGKASAPPGAVDRYDADYVTREHWKPVLDELGAV